MPEWRWSAWQLQCWAHEESVDIWSYIYFGNILWSDEAQFKLSGYVNRYNSVYWDLTNPHKTIETQLNQPGLIVSYRISQAGVYSPYFFEGNVAAYSYLEMLQTYLFAGLQQLPYFSCTSSKMVRQHTVLSWSVHTWTTFSMDMLSVGMDPMTGLLFLSTSPS